MEHWVACSIDILSSLPTIIGRSSIRVRGDEMIGSHIDTPRRSNDILSVAFRCDSPPVCPSAGIFFVHSWCQSRCWCWLVLPFGESCTFFFLPFNGVNKSSLYRLKPLSTLTKHTGGGMHGAIGSRLRIEFSKVSRQLSVRIFLVRRGLS